jgi:hypothetical protein
MFPDRFNIEMINSTEQLFTQPQAAFVLLSVGPVPQMSTMEWLYQQLYQQAQQANRQPATRELFAVMN